MRLLTNTLTNFIAKTHTGQLPNEEKIKNFDFATAYGQKPYTASLDKDHARSIKHYQQLISKKLGEKNQRIEVEKQFITQAGILVFFHQTVKKNLLERNSGIIVYSWLFETAAPDHALWDKPKVVAQLPTPQSFLASFDPEQIHLEEHHFNLKRWELDRVMSLVNTRKTTRGWHFLAIIHQHSEYWSFWWLPGYGVFAKIYPNYLVSGKLKLRHALPLLQKPALNPILKPNKHHQWEAFNTFNPAAFYAAGKVHILYRAQGFDYVSTIGYATSNDGVNIEKRLTKPIYFPTENFEGNYMPPGKTDHPYVSGGSVGGCEDPRVTVIDDRVYMTYVAYDGWSPPRVALTSIALSDFLDHRFLWEKPVLISPPNVVDKSACIFPEKINGKYVIMHRIFPNILIDFVDSLEFNGQRFLGGERKIGPRTRGWWDSRKIGAGAPPIKTKQGWLLIYQAVDDKDASQYKVGAMLLDLEDPSRVIARSSQPIMEPKESYENAGFKAGVIYPCGAVTIKDQLFVYYGGADSYVCVATAKLDQFIEKLIKTGHSNLELTKIGVTV